MEDTSHNADAARTPGAKSAYHHGDLQNALIDAAIGLARGGGPDAVVLRAAARAVGVSPTAAYRHFAGQSDLLTAVKARGQRELADRMAGAAGPRDAPEGGDGPGGGAGPDGGHRPDGAAVERRMLAMGRGYITFALQEPGLFRTAFCDTPEFAVARNALGVPQPTPQNVEFRSFQLLIDVLDDLVASGRMPSRRRPGAEFTAWSLVHGLATLMLDEAALARLDADQREAAIDRAMRTLVDGFTAP